MTSNHIGSSLSVPTGSRSSSGPMKSHKKKLHSLATTFIGYTRKKRVLRSSSYHPWGSAHCENSNYTSPKSKRILMASEERWNGSFIPTFFPPSLLMRCEHPSMRWRQKAESWGSQQKKKSSRCCCTCLPVQPFCCSFNSSLHSSLVDSARYIRRPTGKLWSFDCDFCVAAALSLVVHHRSNKNKKRKRRKLLSKKNVKFTCNIVATGGELVE